jgi:hypothetical protein
MATTSGRPTIRERLSDMLLRVGTESSIDSRYVAESMAAHAGSPHYDAALRALAAAQWVDSALLWLSWRLRPRTVVR